MKLTLKNFRCYDNKEIDFPDEGITLLSGSSGIGKCLGYDTEVLLYNGKIKNVQNLQPGNKLMGDDSNPRKIINIVRGKDRMYEIKTKHYFYVVNSEHILSLKCKLKTLYKNLQGEFKLVLIHEKSLEKQEIYFQNFENAIHYYNSIPNEYKTIDINLKDYLKLPKEIKDYLFTYHTKIHFKQKDTSINVNNYCKLLFQTPQLFQGISQEFKTNSLEIRKKLIANFTNYFKCGNNKNEVILEFREEYLHLIRDINYIILSLGKLSYIKNNKIIIKKNKKECLCKFRVITRGVDNYYGFELENKTNKRFVLSNFIVTHNTSLLLGIDFALFGKGNKLIMTGENSCSVSLTYKNFFIERKKKPNSLKLVNKTNDEILYDECAQKTINNYFGKNFDTISYMKQNNINTFILMSPAEKLCFLETLAFENFDIELLKQNCNNKIKEYNSILIDTSNRLKITSEHFLKLEKPTIVNFPKKTKDKEKFITKINTKYKNTKIRIRKLTKEKEKIEEEIRDVIILDNLLKNNQKIIQDYEEEKEKLQRNVENNLFESEEKLTLYRKKLDYILSFKELVSLKKNYDSELKRMLEMQDNEMKEMTNELKNTQDIIWKEYKKNEIDNNIKENQEILKELDRIEELKKLLTKYAIKDNIEDLRNKIIELQNSLVEKKEILNKIIERGKTYVCPSCNSKLNLNDDKLILITDNQNNEEVSDIKKEILVLEETIKENTKILETETRKSEKIEEIKQELENIISTYEDIPEKKEIEEELEYLKNYKRKNIEFENKIERLNKKINERIFSPTLKALERDLENKKIKIKELETKKTEDYIYDNSIDEEEIRTFINVQNNEKTKLEENKTRISHIMKNLKILLEKNSECREEHLKKYSRQRNILEIEEEKLNICNDLEKQEKKLTEIENKIKTIEDYSKYLKELEIYEEWESKIEELKEKESIDEENYKNSLVLKEKINEAETSCISTLIDTINNYAQQYLEIFFPNESMIVKIQPYKNIKKNNSVKSQINIEVICKGIESDISSLSGGELARVILSYTLALSEISKCPFLLLDECTSSLDQDLTSTVLEGIRNNFGNKMVIIIAHQVISGEFDNRVEL